MDTKKIELVAKEAMRRERIRTGESNIQVEIAKAIAAALEEYDKQKSE